MKDTFYLMVKINPKMFGAVHSSSATYKLDTFGPPQL